MKNAVLWDLPSSYLTGYTLRLRYRIQPVNTLRPVVFTEVTMKKAVFWDIKAISYLTGDT
jgi:hypothetical protein